MSYSLDQILSNSALIQKLDPAWVKEQIALYPFNQNWRKILAEIAVGNDSNKALRNAAIYNQGIYYTSSTTGQSIPTTQKSGNKKITKQIIKDKAQNTPTSILTEYAKENEKGLGEKSELVNPTSEKTVDKPIIDQNKSIETTDKKEGVSKENQSFLDRIVELYSEEPNDTTENVSLVDEDQQTSDKEIEINPNRDIEPIEQLKNEANTTKDPEDHESTQITDQETQTQSESDYEKDIEPDSVNDLKQNNIDQETDELDPNENIDEHIEAKAKLEDGFEEITEKEELDIVNQFISDHEDFEHEIIETDESDIESSLKKDLAIFTNHPATTPKNKEVIEEPKETDASNEEIENDQKEDLSIEASKENSTKDSSEIDKSGTEEKLETSSAKVDPMLDIFADKKTKNKKKKNKRKSKKKPTIKAEKAPVEIEKISVIPNDGNFRWMSYSKDDYQEENLDPFTKFINTIDNPTILPNNDKVITVKKSNSEKAVSNLSSKKKKKKKIKKKRFNESLQKKAEIISEPLADLLASQGHYKEAEAMYKGLSLKYPEKSGFFAAKIKEISNK